MKEIPLSRGLVALVDDEDYEDLIRYNWYASKARNTFYAARNYYKSDGKRSVQRMHNYLMPNISQVDHVNGIGTDNRRENLRETDHRRNQQNRVSHGKAYKGVTYRADLKSPWRARITVNGYEIGLGNYDTPEEAALAYDNAAVWYFGENARRNFRY